jgi:hypothetical protein
MSLARLEKTFGPFYCSRIVMKPLSVQSFTAARGMDWRTAVTPRESLEDHRTSVDWLSEALALQGKKGRLGLIDDVILARSTRFLS